MYMEDIKVSVKNKSELEALIQTIRIYSQDMGMDFVNEKCARIERWEKRNCRMFTTARYGKY